MVRQTSTTCVVFLLLLPPIQPDWFGFNLANAWHFTMKCHWKKVIEMNVCGTPKWSIAINFYSTGVILNAKRFRAIKIIHFLNLYRLLRWKCARKIAHTLASSILFLYCLDEVIRETVQSKSASSEHTRISMLFFLHCMKGNYLFWKNKKKRSNETNIHSFFLIQWTLKLVSNIKTSCFTTLWRIAKRRKQKITPIGTHMCMKSCTLYTVTCFTDTIHRFLSVCSVKRREKKFNLFLKVTTLSILTHTHASHIHPCIFCKVKKKIHWIDIHFLVYILWQIKIFWGKRWHSSKKVSHIGLMWCNLNFLLNEIFV